MFAHAGRPLEPHDLWWTWNLDPLLLGGVLLAVWAYWRGAQRGQHRRPVDTRRAWCFAGAMMAVGVALVSPLDALSGSLASAHMVQHVLLLLVAAPLLALSNPMTTLLRGSPPAVRKGSRRWRQRLAWRGEHLLPTRHPVAAWVVAVTTLWFWHAGVPYDAAVEHHVLHVVEHLTFLVTAVWFWWVVVGARGRERISNGFGVLLVFAMAMQSVFLSALLTFAPTPWYSVYAATTARWNLDPLADQQLAGVIMWIPAGLLYVGAGLGLLVAWIRASERTELAV
ncbi:MAG: cytochrome c oxidase assembly protein [Actinomycetota bacterium]|nr:cytochrome c oxidase assembly protein [Actinomycetota bacterium]